MLLQGVFVNFFAGYGSHLIREEKLKDGLIKIRKIKMIQRSRSNLTNSEVQNQKLRCHKTPFPQFDQQQKSFRETSLLTGGAGRCKAPDRPNPPVRFGGIRPTFLWAAPPLLKTLMMM